MPLVNYRDLKKQMIWQGIIGAIHHSEIATIAHIEVAEGTELPQHDHIHEQWSHVIEGKFEFVIDGTKYLVEEGMAVHIPPHVSHSGRALSSCKMIDCFIPVREDWKNLPYVE